ncbi:PREDICTED: angiotensin-converting enzyme-like [Nicrophorus vespilloides]|uniref:Angiotensin-converting enzyme n=1 Tax=Nicrophorus vespilloides TaxID=110193 RepID=A0ABM1MJI6_NICVS|nr:PREDICTED: angiotensin-converting enzyme-like [Nicrophorus vespilloides]
MRPPSFKICFSLCCLFLAATALGKERDARSIEKYRSRVDAWLDEVDDSLKEFNKLSAKLTWDMSIGKGDDNTVKHAKEILFVRNSWKNRVCGSKVKEQLLRDDQRRKIYLLCRGPKFTDETAKIEMKALNEMRSTYGVEICFPENQPTTMHELSSPTQNISDYPKPGQCLNGEPDLEWLMKRIDLNPDQLKWIWESWHNAVAKDMRAVYPKVVSIQNFVARANGYSDMGAVWRDELEMFDLQNIVMDLYKSVEPLYKMLHAAIRHKLLLKYGHSEIDPTGPLPIHLLGNMWGQDWSPLIKLFDNSNELIDLNSRMKNDNWTIYDMVSEAEDFYTSMDLMAMTRKFWKNSVMDENNANMCHGSAADMFTGDDYRMLLCAKVNMEYFYVMHHEMGHLEYDMAYRYQPAVFQDGANSAIHETIGDAIMHGVMAPPHLQRLGLLRDDELNDRRIDELLLLQQALNKIAEIPFALIVDKYRWDVFANKIGEHELNDAYWKMNEKIRGVVPPTRRSEAYLDVGAKFHVPDNTPYIRYFLSGILQMQVFKGLCELSLYGTHPNEFAAKLDLPLHRCDIYGCKLCGEALMQAMSLGSSVHWSEVLRILTGKSYITTAPLREYYMPIELFLKDYIKANNIPVGW